MVAKFLVSVDETWSLLPFGVVSSFEAIAVSRTASTAMTVMMTTSVSAGWLFKTNLEDQGKAATRMEIIPSSLAIYTLVYDKGRAYSHLDETECWPEMAHGRGAALDDLPRGRTMASRKRVRQAGPAGLVRRLTSHGHFPSPPMVDPELDELGYDRVPRIAGCTASEAHVRVGLGARAITTRDTVRRDTQQVAGWPRCDTVLIP